MSFHPSYVKYGRFEEFESRCHICDVEIKPASNGKFGKTMADHLRSVHNLTREEYHIKIVFNDTRPTCTCCLCTITPEIANPVRWNPNGFFVAYSSGHNRRSNIIDNPSVTALDYFWTTGGGSRIGRQVIQANSKLGLSEVVVASSRGVHRIYAAGSAQFTLKV